MLCKAAKCGKTLSQENELSGYCKEHRMIELLEGPAVLSQEDLKTCSSKTVAEVYSKQLLTMLKAHLPCTQQDKNWSGFWEGLGMCLDTLDKVLDPPDDDEDVSLPSDTYLEDIRDSIGFYFADRQDENASLDDIEKEINSTVKQEIVRLQILIRNRQEKNDKTKK